LTLRRLPATVWALLALAWALLVWGLLTAPDVPPAPLVDAMMPAILLPWEDKLAHAAVFFVQALLATRAASDRLGGTRAALAAVALCAAMGLATEWRQRALPGREADAADFAADLVGGVGAAGLAAMVRRRASRRAPQTAR
jgi:VanZ family protein